MQTSHPPSSTFGGRFEVSEHPRVELIHRPIWLPNPPVEAHLERRSHGTITVTEVHIGEVLGGAVLVQGHERVEIRVQLVRCIHPVVKSGPLLLRQRLDGNPYLPGIEEALDLLIRQ